MIDLGRVVYASGNFAKNLIWGTTEVTLLFVMTEMLHIRADIAGGILLVSLAVDAVLDPVVGILSDKLRSPIGRYGPFILVGAPLAGFSFALLYSLPRLGVGSLCVATSLIFAFRISYSLIDMPHNALLAAVTQDPAEQARLTTYRFFFSSAASLVVALALAPMMKGAPGPGFSASGLAIYGLMAGTLSALVMIAAWRAVAARDIGFSALRETAVPARMLIRLTWRSKAFRRALGVGAVASLTMPLYPKTVLYLAGPVLGQPAIAPWLLGLLVVGQFCGLPLWMAISSRWTHPASLAAAHAVCITGLAVALAGALTDHALLLAGSFIIGIGACGIYSLIWSLIADSASAIRRRSGADANGVVFASAILSQKVAIGIGIAGLSLALQFTGYRSGQMMTGITAAAILCCAFIVPMIGSSLAVLMLRD